MSFFESLKRFFLPNPKEHPLNITERLSSQSEQNVFERVNRIDPFLIPLIDSVLGNTEGLKVKSNADMLHHFLYNRLTLNEQQVNQWTIIFRTKTRQRLIDLNRSSASRFATYFVALPLAVFHEHYLKGNLNRTGIEMTVIENYGDEEDGLSIGSKILYDDNLFPIGYRCDRLVLEGVDINKHPHVVTYCHDPVRTKLNQPVFELFKVWDICESHLVDRYLNSNREDDYIGMGDPIMVRLINHDHPFLK